MIKIREQVFKGFPAPRADKHLEALFDASGNPVSIVPRHCFIFHKDT